MSTSTDQVSFNVPRYETFDELLQFIESFHVPQSSISAFQQDQQAMQNLLFNIQTLKVLGRNEELSKRFTVSNIDALVNNIIAPHFSFDILQEAFSVIANALLINTDLLSTWHAGNAFKVGYEIYSAHAASKDINDKERFIIRRMGFLVTYSGTTIDEEQIGTITDLVIKALRKTPNDILKLYHPELVTPPFSKGCIIELLKLCFNLLHNYPALTLSKIHDNGGMTNIAQSLVYTKTSDPEYADLTRYLLNCLLNATSTATWFDVTSSPDAEPTDFTTPPLPLPLSTSEKDCAPNSSNPSKHVNCAAILTRILDYALVATDPQNIDLLDDANFAPCLTALEQIINTIYVDHKDEQTPKLEQLRQIAESYLLPSDSDRRYPLGSTEAPHSLPHAFSRFSSTVGLQTCTTLVLDIYWKLSHENQEELVQNMGFGFASAYMSSSSVLFGGSNSSSSSKSSSPATDTQSDSSSQKETSSVSKSDGSQEPTSSRDSSVSKGGESACDSKLSAIKNKLKSKTKGICPNNDETLKKDEKENKEINPITGQYLSYEQLTSKMAEIQMSAQKRAQESASAGQKEEEWTEEEKEREAEKMFVLFERLKKNGIIKVANPVEIYQQQGRFENIS